MNVKKMPKRIISALLAGTMMLLLTACNVDLGHGREESESVSTTETEDKRNEKVTKLMNYQGEVFNQTSNIGLDPADKNFKEQLVTGSFYVLHEGKYYPVFSYASNYDFGDETKDYIAPRDQKQMYYSADNEVNIPTLFLAQGDTLVYYDTENVLDYIKWERYKDLGYTIGLYNIQQAEYSKRAYIDLEEDEGCIISGSALEDINADSLASLVSLMKIGNVDIAGDLVQNGLIHGATAGENYDLEVYDGTNYNHYIATADMHAFEAYELFASTEIKALQEFAWEIKVPDYFVDGYYKVNAICTAAQRYDGLVRIVNADHFVNNPDDFNEPLLFPYTEEQIAAGDVDENALLNQYSECEELNKFNTAVVGALGYEDGVKEKAFEEKADILRTANIDTFDINFPKGADCTIMITPSVKESGGDAYVLVGNRTKSLVYNAFDNTYTTSIRGDGNTYTMFISGFWNSYDIRLGNCKQDTSGNSQSVIVDSMTNDEYSLDGYTQKKAEEKGKAALDSLNIPENTDGTETSEDTKENTETESAEEITTEVEEE